VDRYMATCASSAGRAWRVKIAGLAIIRLRSCSISCAIVHGRSCMQSWSHGRCDSHLSPCDVPYIHALPCAHDIAIGYHRYLLLSHL
jgi:hypothetical protein